jgi:hypothetical protein
VHPYSNESSRLQLGGCPYSTRFLEPVFSKTEFPALGLLGNSKLPNGITKRPRRRAPAFSHTLSL